MIKIFSWSIGLFWLLLLISCMSNRSTNRVVVNVHGGKVFYTSGGVEYVRLGDLIDDKHRTDIIEIVFASKMTHNRILLVKEEVNSLGIAKVVFIEDASGLRANMHNGEATTRGKLMDAIRKRE